MNIDAIRNGIVIDHITAGKAMQVYNMLNCLLYTSPSPRD